MNFSRALTIVPVFAIISPRYVKFILRFYPGRDDDLIRWLDDLDREQIEANLTPV